MQKLLALTLFAILLAGCAAANQTPGVSPGFPPITAPPITQTIPAGAPAVNPPPAAGTLSPTTAPPASSSMALSSPAFNGGQTIPPKFTCQGENVSPALAWSSVPAGAKSLAVVVEDPDVTGGFIHWVAYNMLPSLAGLPEKVAPAAQADGIGTQGIGSFGLPGYRGPCPPSGSAHHYYFKLYALDLDPTMPAGLNAASLQKLMAGHILAQAQWMGTVQR